MNVTSFETTSSHFVRGVAASALHAGFRGIGTDGGASGGLPLILRFSRTMLSFRVRLAPTCVGEPSSSSPRCNGAMRYPSPDFNSSTSMSLMRRGLYMHQLRAASLPARRYPNGLRARFAIYRHGSRGLHAPLQMCRSTSSTTDSIDIPVESIQIASSAAASGAITRVESMVSLRFISSSTTS